MNKERRNLAAVHCNRCDKPFEMDSCDLAAEAKRQKTKKPKVYCSKKCLIRYFTKKMPLKKDRFETVEEKLMDKKLAKRVLFDIADTLESIGLQFFLAFGACLGAYREGDFIDYDNDIDLIMKAEEFVPNSSLMMEKIRKKGYDIAEGEYPFRQVNRMSVMKWAFNLSIVSLYLIGNERWLPKMNNSLVYPARLFENPEQIEFLGRRFNIPMPVTEYLELTYGSDYMTPKRMFVYPDKTYGDFDASKVSEELK